MPAISDVPFKLINTFESRLEESRRIRDKFPGRVPVIVERGQRSLSVPSIDKQKFLVPGDLSVSQFIFVIRKRLNLSSEQALFLFIGNTLPTTGMLIRELHASYADADGFLYATYCGENVFG
jgi:GABA(A) receptor-associated protein